MRRVECIVEVVDLEGDYAEVEGVCVTCTRCGHEAESFGTSDRSIRRSLAQLRDGCPNREVNYYVERQDAGSDAA